MRRRIVIWALMAAILLTAGCKDGGMAPVIWPPGSCGDSSGGAIVIYAVYETLTEQDYYVQRISPAGDFLWGERGVLIGSTGNGIPRSEAVSDGSGGAIVIWGEWLPQVPGEPLSGQTYAARIDSEGNVKWRRDIPGIEKAIPDGSGGVIIAFDDPSGNISVLKMDSEGNLPWGQDGVSLSLPDAYLSSIASDNSGGVIVVECSYQGDSDALYAQRVDSEGSILWQTGGVQAWTGSAGQAQVASDGAGGAIIAYMRDIPCEDGIGFCDSDIYAQRIDAEGNVLWGSDGVPICVGPSVPDTPGIVTDGAGGAIVSWADERGVYARRIDADGNKLWDGDVELLATRYYSRVTDGSGGAICVWYGGGGISAAAQRIDAAGTKLWGPNGTTLTFRDLYGVGPVSDGCGGLLIPWVADVKFRNYEVANVSYYVQKIDAEGNVVWGDEGILLNP